VVMIGLAMQAARNGDTGAAARIPLYGMISSGLLVLIVIFAVWAFANV
jgi:hypothetical protein